MIDTPVLRRVGRSPATWVLIGTLIPAVVFTILARILYPEWWKMVGYFWYSIPGNSFAYLPHEPAVVYAGAIYDAWVVAVVGGVATMIAAIVDYFVVKKVFELRRVAPVKQTAIYKTAVRYFNLRPWATIAVFAVSPLPYHPIRLLAPSSGYPIWRYVSAYTLGRIPRYYLLAMGGAWVPVPTRYILVMVVSIILASVVGVLWARRRARMRQESHATLGDRPSRFLGRPP